MSSRRADANPRPPTSTPSPQVGIHGLRTPFRGGTLRDVSQQVLEIAKGGLERRGHDEAAFLKSLQLIVESGKTPADAMLEVRGVWGGVGLGVEVGVGGGVELGRRCS